MLNSGHSLHSPRTRFLTNFKRTMIRNRRLTFVFIVGGLIVFMVMFQLTKVLSASSKPDGYISDTIKSNENILNTKKNQEGSPALEKEPVVIPPEQNGNQRAVIPQAGSKDQPVAAPPKETAKEAGPPPTPKDATPSTPQKPSNRNPKYVDFVGAKEFNTYFTLKELRPLYIGNVSGNTFRQSSHEVIYEPSQKSYPPIRNLPLNERKRILVTGGAGFVGSHLVDRLMKMGHYVTVLDNFFTGNRKNVEHWLGHPHFELVRHDIIDPYLIEVDEIYHLACPASPPFYQHNPIKTVKTSVMGTINMLGLAKRVKAKFLFTSTSEVYGDPEVHPQVESYWGKHMSNIHDILDDCNRNMIHVLGHVNPIGPRACYDEGKRVAETLTYAYQKQDNVQVRVVRIFNTFGPRMNPNDGRVVSNFIMQALRGEPITIYGDGSQTRSFQYVHDLVDGLIQAMESNFSLPMNLGNPDEHTIKEFAEIIRDKIGSNSKIVHVAAATDDPQKRKPDIDRAKKNIKWDIKYSMEQGIEETIEYFRQIMHEL